MEGMTWKNLWLATAGLAALAVTASLLAQQPRGGSYW